ncbi:tripartite motif-containing protein 2-like [Ptychodera flava]|uniref:tripartite motif-containing protein 2-like n=1 Tax=Ptychodera flava TaxID=63121 RepID=UPI00396A9D30
MAATPEIRFLEEIGEDFLCCTICLEKFKSPKILPCLHTFCESCLVTLVEKAGRLNCPECRQPHQIPVGGVPAIKGNFFMKNMVAIFKQRLESVQGAEIKCEGCEENTASHRCMECKQYFCSSCTKVHTKVSQTRTHKLMTIEEYKTTKSTSLGAIEVVEYCSIHAENKIEFFCETCKVPVCTNCTIVKHRIPEHLHRDLKDAADEYLTELKAMVDELKVKEQEAEKNKILAQQIRSYLTEQCSRQEQKVRMKTAEIIEKIRREEQRLIAMLNSNYMMKLKNAVADIDEMELQHGNIKSACSFIETLMHHGNAVQLLSTKSDVCNRIEQLITMETEPKTQHDEVVFAGSDDFNEQGILGILQSEVCVSKCTVENIPKQLFKGDSADLLITTRDSTGNQVIPIQPVKAKIQKPDASWEDINASDNRDGTHRVRVFGQIDGDYQINITIAGQPIQCCPVIVSVVKGLMKTIGSRGSGVGQYITPYGVAINRDRDIVITDHDNSRLQITNKEGRCKKIFKSKEFENPFSPRGITLSSNNIYSTDDINKEVIVSDEYGVFIRSFGQNELENPRDIALSPDGNAYVTDGNSHCVRVYTQHGKYLRSFGSKGEGHGEFNEPWGIVVACTGMVFVTDCDNKRIQVFSAHDQYLYSFDCQGEDGQLRCPFGISIENDKYVYVVAGNDTYGNRGYLLKFDSGGKFVCRIDSDQDGLNWPNGIALTDDVPPRVIVADTNNHCIKLFVQ